MIGVGSYTIRKIEFTNIDRINGLRIGYSLAEDGQGTGYTDNPNQLWLH
jgi:hypothetical protein